MNSHPNHLAMLEYSEIPDELKPINDRHIPRSDKFFRMFAGASTHLTALHEGCFELETRIDHRKRKVSDEQLARNIARSWSHNPELSSCSECIVRFYQSAGPTGFAVPAKKIKETGTEGLARILMAKFRAMAEAEKQPAPLIAEYSIALTPDSGSPQADTHSRN